VDDELIRVCGLATRVACQRMTPHYLRALCDSVEQACCLPVGFAWDRKAMAHAEMVNVLADSAADPVLVLLVRNVPGQLYDLMVTAGPTADGIIASSRRRLLALIRARDADGAGREMEQHLEGLSSIAERRRVAHSRSVRQGRDRFPSRAAGANHPDSAMQTHLAGREAQVVTN
jgi:DNA-binding FadR family transcriptional regulator